MSNRRIAGGAGLLFVVMNVIAAFAPGNPPKYDDPIDKIVQFVVEKDSQIVGASFVVAISMVFALVFFIGLWRILRSAEGDGFDFSTVFLGGAVATVAIVTVGSAIMAVPSFESEQLGTPKADIVRFSQDASGLCFVLASGVIVALVLAASLSIFRGRGLPVWLAWLGVLAAGAEVAGGLGVTSHDLYKLGLFLGFVPIMVWFLATSVTLLASQET